MLDTIDPFLKSICLLIFLLVFHFLVIVMDSGLPLALLYGSALFYSHVTLQGIKLKKRIFIGLALPFILLGISYVVLRISGVSFEEMTKHYYPVYFILSVLSLLILPVLVLVQRDKWELSVNPLKSILIQQLAVSCIAIALCIALILINMFYDLNFDIHPQVIIMMLMVFIMVILGRYIYLEISWGQDKSRSTASLPSLSNNSRDHSLPKELLEEYAVRIHNCFFQKELYLLPGLSLEVLAKETKIPRHHLSELFNAHLGKSFYRLIAEYRIEKAVSLFEESGYSLTIEALAYECGFNSKTSFNKHFKEITGFLPSEFRAHQLV